MKTKKMFFSIPALLLLLVAFFTSLTKANAQEVSLASATKLANFVILNADSTDKEGDATSHHLWFPSIGLKILVSTLGKEVQTLEVYDYDFKDEENNIWCLNFSCQSGNIYAGLYANKYLPTTAKGKISIFESIIEKLNTVSIATLTKERVEQKKLHAQINKWGEKPISYESYSKVEELLSYKDLGVTMYWKGDVLSDVPAPVEFLYFAEPTLQTLRNILSTLPTPENKN